MDHHALRIALQRCQSRILLAVQALDFYKQRLAQVSGPLPIYEAAELLFRTDAIRALLTDEEVDCV